MKQARRSFGKPYNCNHDWPEDCFVQCGDNGLVFTKGGLKEVFEDTKKGVEAIGAVLDAVPTPPDAYQTAFFEAFPRNPDTFIRGEGATVEQAENAAWEKYQRYLKCSSHEFERRDYRNGAGFCKHCGLFKSKAFEPLEHCVICGIPTYNSHDKDGNWYCEEHFKDIPEDKLTELQKSLPRTREWMKVRQKALGRSQ